MKLLVNKDENTVTVVESNSPRLRHSTIEFSSKLGQFIVKMAYDRKGTVEYV